MNNLVGLIVENLKNIYRRRVTHKKNIRRFSMLANCGIERKHLSRQQIQEVDAIYKRFNAKYTYATHELVYSVTGKFDPLIVPEDLFRTLIGPKLCEQDIKYFLSDKNYFDIFMPTIRFPNTIVKNIRGSFYNNQFELISKDQAISLVQQYEKVVVKPSNDSGFGKGVALIDLHTTDPFAHRSKDYIIQEVLKQHASFSKLNESSVNVVRIVTLFINDKVRVITAAMRIGGVGDFADNVEHKDGSGMIVVGIENGKLKKYGYHSNGSKVTSTPGGVVFENYEIQKYELMCNIAIQEHKKYPQVRFIGWDFTLDSNSNVVVMEYNTKSPGVLYYQYTNGPLFGNSTKEMFDWLEEQK